MRSLVDRAAACERTVLRFARKPFGFGTADCARLARYHLIGLGYKVPALPRYTSVRGAVRALKTWSRGGDSLEAALARVGLLPIAPAAMLPADIAILESAPGHPLDAIAICCGRELFGWHDDDVRPVFLDSFTVKAAFRV